MLFYHRGKTLSIHEEYEVDPQDLVKLHKE
jgi:hypothetical protein